MVQREYFYKNAKGEIVPYHYCSECGKKYTNEDFNVGLIINVGSKTTPIKYCAKPCLSIKFPAPSPKKEKSSSSSETEESIIEDSIKIPDIENGL